MTPVSPGTESGLLLLIELTEGGEIMPMPQKQYVYPPSEEVTEYETQVNEAMMEMMMKVQDLALITGIHPLKLTMDLTQQGIKTIGGIRNLNVYIQDLPPDPDFDAPKRKPRRTRFTRTESPPDTDNNNDEAAPES